MRHCSRKKSLEKWSSVPQELEQHHLFNRTQLTALYPPSSTIIDFNQVSGTTTLPSTKVIFLGLISLVPWFARLGAKHAAALHIPPLLKRKTCLLMDVSTCVLRQRKSSGLMSTHCNGCPRETLENSQIKSPSKTIQYSSLPHITTHFMFWFYLDTNPLALTKTHTG